MRAEIDSIPHIVCPYCGEGRAAVGHLRPGQAFGPWFCDDCGKAYTGERTKSGATIELLPRWKREVPILLEYIDDPKLKLVVPGIELSNDDGTESKYYSEEDGHGYFYDESTCPSNLLRDGHQISAEVIHGDDKDPHGVFRFVRVIKEEEGKATDGLPQTHMATQEIADLSAEAGRPLSEEQAEAYRRRKLTWDGVERRMEDVGNFIERRRK